jgi:hypothetical protein
MIDAQQVLAQVASGVPAPSWQVLRIRGGYLVGRVFAGVFGTLIGGIGAGFAAFFALGGFGGIGGTDGTAALFFFVLPLAVAAIFAVVGIFFLVSGLAALVMLFQPPAQRPVLVLLPDGAVERRGLFAGRIRAVAYADLTHAQMRITTTRATNANTGATTTSVQHAVVFTHRDGRRETWKLDGAYGRPDDIISRILTAQIQFSALHAPGDMGR